MNKLRVLFFFGLLAVVILIARHNSRPTSRAESPTFGPAPSNVVSTSPTPAASAATVIANQSPPPAQANATPSPEFQKAAERVAPSVALISTFDPSGNLLRTGMGCFISHDGRFITTSALAQGAANAVAKASDGRIINVSGILADAPELDLAVLKAETKKGVTFFSPTKAVSADIGTRVIVVGNQLTRRRPVHFETTISARRSDQSGEWLELASPVPPECGGAPVINEKGELIGVITSQHGQGSDTNVVRVAGIVESVVAKIDPRASTRWLVAQNGESPAPPAEGPTKPPRFAKIPLVQADQPGSSRLVYSPKPPYPTDARHSHFPLKGNGKYRVTFAASGEVKDVEVLESTRSQTLDGAATEALRKWKATPGHEWSATVPITFQP